MAEPITPDIAQNLWEEGYSFNRHDKDGQVTYEISDRNYLIRLLVGFVRRNFLDFNKVSEAANTIFKNINASYEASSASASLTNISPSQTNTSSTGSVGSRVLKTNREKGNGARSNDQRSSLRSLALSDTESMHEDAQDSVPVSATGSRASSPPHDTGESVSENIPRGVIRPISPAPSNASSGSFNLIDQKQEEPVLENLAEIIPISPVPSIDSLDFFVMVDPIGEEPNQKQEEHVSERHSSPVPSTEGIIYPTESMIEESFRNIEEDSFVNIADPHSFPIPKRADIEIEAKARANSLFGQLVSYVKNDIDDVQSILNTWKLIYNHMAFDGTLHSFEEMELHQTPDAVGKAFARYRKDLNIELVNLALGNLYKELGEMSLQSLSSNREKILKMLELVRQDKDIPFSISAENILKDLHYRISMILFIYDSKEKEKLPSLNTYFMTLPTLGNLLVTKDKFLPEKNKYEKVGNKFVCRTLYDYCIKEFLDAEEQFEKDYGRQVNFLNGEYFGPHKMSHETYARWIEENIENSGIDQKNGPITQLTKTLLCQASQMETAQILQTLLLEGESSVKVQADYFNFNVKIDKKGIFIEINAMMALLDANEIREEVREEDRYICQVVMSCEKNANGEFKWKDPTYEYFHDPIFRDQTKLESLRTTYLNAKGWIANSKLNPFRPVTPGTN